MNPLPLSVRDPVRFQLDSIHNYVCKRIVRTMERGLNGEIDKDQAAGYAVGMRAALAILERTAPVPKGVDELDRLRQELANISRRGFTLNVAIITSQDTPGQSQSDGGTIRVVAGEGDGP